MIDIYISNKDGYTEVNISQQLFFAPSLRFQSPFIIRRPQSSRCGCTRTVYAFAFAVLLQLFYVHEIKRHQHYLKILPKSGFTRKMIIIAAQQSSDSLRAEYLLDMSVYKGHPKMFVFVDNMRSDKRDSICLQFAKKSYTSSRKLLVQSEWVSTTAGISWAGLLDCNPFTGSVTADWFKNYAEKALIPHFQPFNRIIPTVCLYWTMLQFTMQVE